MYILCFYFVWQIRLNYQQVDENDRKYQKQKQLSDMNICKVTEKEEMIQNITRMPLTTADWTQFTGGR